MTGNSGEQGLRRRFAPGVSGNPSGRPPVVREFRRLCQGYMDEQGWERLKRIANGRNQLTSLRALELIAAYAYGRPAATVDVVVQQYVERFSAILGDVSTDELLAEARAIASNRREW